MAFANTNICVLHTLADTSFLGYDTVVVEHATRAFLCGHKRRALSAWRNVAVCASPRPTSWWPSWQASLVVLWQAYGAMA